MHASTQKQPPLKRSTVAAGRVLDRLRNSLGAALPCEVREFREPWRGPAAFVRSWGVLGVSKGAERCAAVHRGRQRLM